MLRLESVPLCPSGLQEDKLPKPRPGQSPGEDWAWSVWGRRAARQGLSGCPGPLQAARPCSPHQSPARGTGDAQRSSAPGGPESISEDCCSTRSLPPEEPQAWSSQRSCSGSALEPQPLQSCPELAAGCAVKLSREWPQRGNRGNRPGVPKPSAGRGPGLQAPGARC